MSTTGAVCVLHGDPVMPAWLTSVAQELPLVLVLNDAGPGRYTRLPDGAHVVRNATPCGFAANVNQGIAVLRRHHDVDVVMLLNFDLKLEPITLVDLADVVRTDQTLAAAAAALHSPTGAPVFSTGRLPGPAREFARAAGLRGPAAVARTRRLLRLLPTWRQRNAPAQGRRRLSVKEYLPWSCIAVSLSAWDRIGPLDERYRLYAEDIDWCIRAHRCGFGLELIATSSPVVHDERATASPLTDAWYESSHRALHAKWGWTLNGAAQRAGLVLRTRTPLGRWAPPLDMTGLQ